MSVAGCSPDATTQALLLAAVITLVVFGFFVLQYLFTIAAHLFLPPGCVVRNPHNNRDDNSDHRQ